MSKTFLADKIREINPDTYSWNLYFLKIDGRKQNPYYTFKHTFRSPDYLSDYIVSLKETVIRYQIEPLDAVQIYDGKNSKTSCDKLSTSHELISEPWSNLTSSVAGAPRERITGKYQGYILDGQPVTHEFPSIIFVKAGNPVIALDKKNTKVFRHTSSDELEAMTDELCRLYLTTDFVVIGGVLYSFNHNFEGILRIEKTLHRLKNEAINDIMQTSAFKDPQRAQAFLTSYTSPKTFLTLKPPRVSKLREPDGRLEISSLLELQIDNGKIVLENQEQANQLIKYLCYKIFQDKETDKLIEVSSVVNDNVLSR